jgi:hypothetical protein
LKLKNIELLTIFSENFLTVEIVLEWKWASKVKGTYAITT